DARGDVGLVNAIDADLGLDRVEDGDFRGVLPPGNYVVVAQNPDGSARSLPLSASIAVGERTVIVPRLPEPAAVVYRVVDARGELIPAKLSFVSLGEDGAPLFGDGRRRPYLGEGRLNDGVRQLEWTTGGEGRLRVEPGRYDIVVSRGPEYSVHRVRDVTLLAGQQLRVDALLRREVDTEGWMSADMHLHS